MTNLQILEKNFNNGMNGTMEELTTFKEFRLTYTTLLNVILKSMEEVERNANASNLEKLKKYK